jgi:hypothetical protein
MMDEVLKAHPNSAKAHFVEAELLAKQGRISGAQAELATAERLEPGLGFAKPASVQELRNRLTSSQAVPANHVQSTPSAAPSVPWGMISIGVILLLAIVFFLRSRNQGPTVIQAAPAYGPYGPGGPAPQGFGSGAYGPAGPYGPAAPSAGMGSGILGGLATGAAVGAGIVAGEALMHRMVDGGDHRANPLAPQNNDWDNSAGQSQYDMGGNDFGVADSGSWDSGSSGGSDDWS